MPPSDADNMGPARRVATVDVGTNSIRLLVAEARSDGGYRLLDDEKVVARLGRGMSKSRRLDTEAMDVAVQAIAHMREIADGYNVELLRAVATWAVREAENRDEFLALVRDRARLDLEIIDGKEEARLAYLSVRRAFDIEDLDTVVADIGGGSTEIVVTAGGVVEQIDSVALGAMRLTELAAARPGPPANAIRWMRRHVRAALKKHIRKPAVAPNRMIGTGGTFTALAHIDLLRHGGFDGPGEAPAGVRGHEVARSRLRHLIDMLHSMQLQQREDVPGLSPDRAEIIVAGLTIAEGVMKWMGVNTLIVHDRGIRDGLLLSMTGELFPDADAGSKRRLDPIAAARRFAERCRYEAAHSEHVTQLALQIFDDLIAQLPDTPDTVAGPEARRLLEAAAILHDVGYYINYERHHKHSRHLIIHSGLAGFTHRELSIVAAIARYHRRAHPKSSHPEFRRLADDDQTLVLHLAGVLRVADGLDRAHATNVRAVRVEVEPHTVWLSVTADRRPEVDLWGAARKSRLLRKVLGREIRLVWADEPDGRGDADTDEAGGSAGGSALGSSRN